VPRTVKLSQRFYEKFGHDLVNEMVNWFNETDTTYRAELRELNDLNFARFDAKLEQRLTELAAGLRQELAQLRVELREGIAALRGEFRAELGTQLGRVEAELGGLRGEFRAALEAEGRSVIKWMFGFWMAAVTTLGGLVVAVVHFLPAAR
jgi:hypothetical protein